MAVFEAPGTCLIPLTGCPCVENGGLGCDCSLFSGDKIGLEKSLGAWAGKGAWEVSDAATELGGGVGCECTALGDGDWTF